MFNRSFALTACVVAVAGLVMAASTQALSPVPKVNHLTFSRSVALPGVVLPAGTYTFESNLGGMYPNLVRVTTADRQRAMFLGFTVRIQRPAGSAGNRVVSVGEAPAGEAPPIVAWYPIGSNTGHEFLYR